MEFEKPMCPVVEVDGAIACGKQFDLDITLPCDNRNVIYGVIKNCYKEPVKNAVVKLVEVVYECGKEERRPVSHTFTDEDGEFVFGPLCPDKKYEIDFWVDEMTHYSLKFAMRLSYAIFSISSLYFLFVKYIVVSADNRL